MFREMTQECLGLDNCGRQCTAQMSQSQENLVYIIICQKVLQAEAAL